LTITPIPYKDSVNTESNLSSKVLRNILAILGLDYSVYSTKEKLIDEKLVWSRNSIAHGEYLMVDVATYLELHEQIFALMTTLRNQIDNAATLRQYRAVP
jgi:hypothetical protein